MHGNYGQSIGLREYDSTWVGSYFVTVCIQHREPLLGVIADGAVVLNAPGEKIASYFTELEQKFSSLKCDSWVCMPNHVHFIVSYTGCQLPDHCKHGRKSLSEVINWFKTVTTNAYLKGIKEHHWPPFRDRLWQRNYFERVIRDDEELCRIKEYIQLNPEKWDKDSLNPKYGIG